MYRLKLAHFKQPLLDDIKTPLLYWKTLLKKSFELADIAIRLHTLPASSAAVERTFSLRKRIETPERNQLKASTVAKLMKVKCHFRSKNIEPIELDDNSSSLDELIEIPEADHYELSDDDD